MRSDIYKTDCRCKRNAWPLLTEAIEHLKSCRQAKAVYYNSPYGEPVKVRDKVDIK